MFNRQRGGRQTPAVQNYQRLERRKHNRKRREQKGIVSDARKMGGPRPNAQIPQINRKLRFRAALASDLAVNITDQEVTRLIVHQVSTTSVFPVIGSFKISRVTVWGISDTSPGAPLAALAFRSLDQAGQARLPEHIDEGGITGNACVACVPPKDSSAAVWNAGTGNVTLFSIRGRSGTDLIVDVELNYVEIYGSSTSGTISTEGELGNIRFAALDNDESTPVLLADVPSAFRLDGQIS
jgi:hypothetical protein